MPYAILVASDFHYACDAEKHRGDFVQQAIERPALRLAIKLYRHFIWLRDPLAHNGQLDRLLAHPGPVDLAVANGDYSCDSAFVGVSDDAALESARLCLDKLRARFEPNFRAVFGDHELGKKALGSNRGGLRLASWQRARKQLGLEPFWQLDVGRYRLMGVVSSLIALPVYLPETLPEERAQWEALRRAHLAEIRHALASLGDEARVLLFCHDPTALPFLAREAGIASRLNQVAMTVVGHLHSPLYLKAGRLLSGMPTIDFLGTAIRRMSTALHQARHWRSFNVQLCPALMGIELLKDGGYLVVQLAPDGRTPPEVNFHPLRR
jgi:hypothetical protein